MEQAENKFECHTLCKQYTKCLDVYRVSIISKTALVHTIQIKANKFIKQCMIPSNTKMEDSIQKWVLNDGPSGHL